MNFIFRIFRALFTLIGAIAGVIKKIYDRTPAKILSFLILLSTIPFIGYGIYWAFFLNIGNITFQSYEETTGSTNNQAMTIELRKKTLTIQAKSCQGTCTFSGLPAGEYGYLAKMNDRVALTGTVKIARNSDDSKDLLWRYDIGLIDIKKKTQTGSTERTGTQEPLPLNFEDGRKNPFEVRTDPLRLSIQNQTGSIFTSNTAVDYQANSLDTGIFFSIERNGTTVAFDTKNGLTHEFNWWKDEKIVRAKRLTSTDYWAVSTDKNLYLYHIYNKTSDSLGFYDDIEVTKSGKMIALVKNNSSNKREILNITEESGDILFDISEVGSPKILKRWISWAQRLFYFEKGVFGGNGSGTGTNTTTSSETTNTAHSENIIQDTIGIVLEDGKRQIIAPYE
jgi:hypothetical protein